MSILRMVNHDDLEGLIALSETVDGYMTTMPNDAEKMKERISLSINSVNANANSPDNKIYFFVLEEDNEIIGVSAIYANLGVDRPFYSYRITNITKVSTDLDIRSEKSILSLVNDFNGCAEVATLFLKPEKRGNGRGALLSYARFLFMAAHRERFPDRVMAEIRGWTDTEGNSPFWDAVGKRFFEIEMDEADKLSGDEFQFMADLMPKYPIYIDLLPESAQEVIAKPNDSAKGALKMLKDQGFRYENQVDIFDAGICIEAWLDNLKLMTELRELPVLEKEHNDESKQQYALVVNAALAEFRVVNTSVSYADSWANTSSVSIDATALNDLNLSSGDQALIYLL